MRSSKMQITNNEPLLKVFFEFTNLLDGEYKKSSSKTLSVVIKERFSMIEAIETNKQASTHCKKVLLLLTDHFTNKFIFSDKMAKNILVCAIALVQESGSYLKCRQASALYDRYFILTMDIVTDLFAGAYSASIQDNYLKYLEMSRAAISEFLKNKDDIADDCVLLARFLQIKLLYAYKLHLAHGGKFANSSLLNRVEFERACKNVTLMRNDDGESPQDIVWDCFRQLISIYQFNASLAAINIIKKGKPGSASLDAVISKIQVLTSPAMTSMMANYAASLASDGVSNFIFRDLKLPLFCFLVEEIESLSSLVEGQLSQLSSIADSKSAESDGSWREYNLLWQRKRYTEWRVDYLLNSAVEACLRCPGYHDRVSKLKENLSLINQALDRLRAVKSPFHDCDLIDPDENARRLGKIKVSPLRSTTASIIANKAPTQTSNPAKTSVASVSVMEKAEFWLDVPCGVAQVIEQLKRRGFKVYIVGGAVRDIFFNSPPNDYDLVTTAPIGVVAELFYLRGKMTGSLFLTFSFDDLPLQISPMVSRASASSPETLFMGDGIMRALYRTECINSDSEHRDFTCNALYYDPDDRSITDPHQGLAAIKSRKIVFINAIDEALKKDPVLIFRAVRLMAKFKMTLSPSDEEYIKEHPHLLQKIDCRRYEAEFEKTLKVGVEPGLVEALLRQLNILASAPDGHLKSSSSSQRIPVFASQATNTSMNIVSSDTKLMMTP